MEQDENPETRWIRRLSKDAGERQRENHQKWVVNTRKHYLLRGSELAVITVGLTGSYLTDWNTLRAGPLILAAVTMTIIALVLWDAMSDYQKQAAQARMAAVLCQDIQDEAQAALRRKAPEESRKALEDLEDVLRRSQRMRL